MRILAIETTDRSGSVALLEGGRVAAASDLDSAMRSAQSLAPGIATLLDTAGWVPGHIKLVAVATGPGSFTGLRVGVTTAKLFAYAVGAQVRGVNSLEAIACHAPRSSELWAVMDAQRDQLFAARFDFNSTGEWQWRGSTELIGNDEWLEQLMPNQWVTGPALAKLSDRLPKKVRVVDSARWLPKAEIIGQLAWRNHERGARDDVYSLLPQYFRRSAAEEKLSRPGHP